MRANTMIPRSNEYGLARVHIGGQRVALHYVVLSNEVIQCILQKVIYHSCTSYQGGSTRRCFRGATSNNS